MNNPIIIFIGPSYSGKSTISKHISQRLSLSRLNFDSLLHNHNVYDGDEDELLDMLEESIQEGYKIIDIGGNTLTTLSKEQIERFKQIVGETAIIYHIRPLENSKLSYKFLCSRVDKENSNNQTYVIQQKNVIKKDCESDIYYRLQTHPTILTLDNIKSNFIKTHLYKFISDKTYLELLHDISSNLLQDVENYIKTTELEINNTL